MQIWIVHPISQEPVYVYELGFELIGFKVFVVVFTTVFYIIFFILLNAKTNSNSSILVRWEVDDQSKSRKADNLEKSNLHFDL